MTRAMNNITYIIKAIMALAVCLAIFSCQKTVEQPEPEVKDRVLLYYAAGFNNLSGDLEEDIEELSSEGYVPQRTSGNVLLIFQNLAQGSYSNPVSPVLYRVYKDDSGNIVRNTLLTLEAGTVAASAETVNTILTTVRDTYPSYEYGMIFSSHATGWLPASGTTVRSMPGENASPLSIGNEYSPETGTSVQYEINLPDFADAIPMHLDYILFDACFMGGVEVAYQLKDKCDRVAFSQAEVLADGFDYTSMASQLLQSSSGLYEVCKTYYEHYMGLPGDYQSATVSLVDCRMMEQLAQVCKEIYSTHREELDNINPNDVQCFGRISEHRYFYDLADIMEQLDLSSSEQESFSSALDGCIIYAATTGKMINLTIDRFCGLSSYCTNKFTYDDFYKTLAWNQATCMIE